MTSTFGDPAAKPLWRPERPEDTPIYKYRERVNTKFNAGLKSSHELHKWTITNKHEFWIDLWDYVGMVPALPQGITKAFDDTKSIAEVPAFFPEVRVNYTENVFASRDPNALALIGLREGQPLDGESRWSWAELAENVRQARSALLQLGTQRGDRVGALMSNSPWTIALFLACASMGAVFTSISPEMGLEGCVSRLVQVQPSIFFADSHQTYKGTRRSLKQKIWDIVQTLTYTSGVRVYLVPLASEDHHEEHDFPYLEDFLFHSRKDDALKYTRVPFNEPLVIVYSSGTTGAPKCIMHHHGTILQYKKIALLHNSLTPKDTVFQYSSTSWILWNIMNGHLSTGASLICYDGSPLYPNPSTLLKILEHHKCTYFGTSPRYLLELEMAGKHGISTSQYDLSSLRMVTTTGATLTAEQARWFYSPAGFPSRIHLSSVAGGTEIASSWLASDPAGPVYAGEMQMAALGMDVDVADPLTGKSIKHTGEPGELVCRTPFVSMPVSFWGDKGGKKYQEAYFEKFRDVGVECWTQHDWMQYNPFTGGAQIHGRSDGTLNPSGIRFGSAEIYSVSESPTFTSPTHHGISDTLCVGRKRPTDRDESVFLFVKMQSGFSLTAKLRSALRNAIKSQLSPRHVPRFIVPVKEIPVTVNGKKVEIAVKRILAGSSVKVSGTVANPSCLAEYVRYAGVEAEDEVLGRGERGGVMPGQRESRL